MRSLKEQVTWNWYLTVSFTEKRMFPAIDIPKSSTRREDLLLNKDEQEAVEIMRRALNGMRAEEAVEKYP